MAYTQSNSLNTRIKLKYDSYKNWYENNPKLLPGEVAIAYLEDTSATFPNPNPPQILIKVGDKNNANYRDLNFVSAVAADVHGWAKRETASFEKEEFLGWNSWLEQYIVDLVGETIEDTNTTYTLKETAEGSHIYQLYSKNIGDESETIVEGSQLNLTSLYTETEKLRTLVGEDSEGTVNARIKTAVDNMQDTILEGITVTPSDGGDAKNGVVTGVTVANGVFTVTTDKIALADITDGQTKLDDLEKELRDELTITWSGTYTGAEGGRGVTEDTLDKKIDDVLLQVNGAMHFIGKVTPSGENTFNSDVNAFYASLDKEPAAGDVILYGDSEEYVYFAITDAEGGITGGHWEVLGNEGIYATSADFEAYKTTTNGKISAIEGNITTLQNNKVETSVVDDVNVPSSTNRLLTEATVDSKLNAFSAAHVGEVGAKDSQYKYVNHVKLANGVLTGQVQDLNIDAVNGLPTALANKVETSLLEKTNTPSTSNPLISKTTLDNAIQTAKNEVTGGVAFEVKASANNVVTGFEVANGVLKEGTLTTMAISEVGRTGNIKDLVETPNEYVVFDCGSSSVNI